MPVRRKACLRRRDLIGADGQFRDVVRAFGIGGSLAGQMSGSVPNDDRDAGDTPAAGIAYRTVESAPEERSSRPGTGSEPDVKKKYSVASSHPVSVVRQ